MMDKKIKEHFIKVIKYGMSAPLATSSSFPLTNGVTPTPLGGCGFQSTGARDPIQAIGGAAATAAVTKGSLVELLRTLFGGRDHTFERDNKGQIIAFYNSICSTIKNALKRSGIEILLPRHRSVKEMREYVDDVLQSEPIHDLNQLEKIAQAITIDEMRELCNAIVRGDRCYSGKSGYELVSEWLDKEFRSQNRKNSTELNRERREREKMAANHALETAASTKEVLESARDALNAVLPEGISVKALVKTVEDARPKLGEDDESFDARTVIAELLSSVAPIEEAAAAAASAVSPPDEGDEDDWEAAADAIPEKAAGASNALGVIVELYTTYVVAKAKHVAAAEALQRFV